MKIKNLITKGKAKIIALGAVISTAFMSVTAHAAEGSASDAVVGAVTSGVGEVKTIFIALFSIVIGAAMGIFAMKFAAKQGIGFFSSVSKKG